MKTTMRVLINLEERVTVRLTDAGRKVYEEAVPPSGPPQLRTSGVPRILTVSIQELLKIFGPTFRAERNPQLFENNDFELHLGY